MKNILALVGLCFISLVTQATIIRVNNNSAVLGTYTTAQAAHNAATAGDTIHLETSINSYGSVTCTKSLVWIGNGFFADASRASFVDNVIFSSGSANTLFLGIHCTGDATISSTNITISRCCIFGLNLNGTTANLCNNFSLNQSFVRYNTTYTSGNPCSGFTFTNNYFMGSFNMPSTYSNIVYSHNYFNTYSGGLAVAANNNIFYNCSSLISLYSTTVYNNLFVGSNNGNYVGTNGNINTVTNLSISNNTVFISNTTISSDAWTTLKVGSPALNNGLGGVHIGPSGGSSAYKLLGVPPIPTFSQFQVQSAPVNTLPVIISTKSNN